MTVGLLHAEWIKLRRLRTTWLLPLLPLVLMLAGGIRIVYALAETSRTFGFAVDETILQSFAFPQPLLNGLQFVSILGTLLVVLFIAAIVGNEFGYDTWKTVLTRRAQRGQFLMVKLGYALAEITITLILVPLLFQAVLLIALRLMLSTAPPTDFSRSNWEAVGITFVVAWVRLAIAATIGLLSTVLTRSSASGMALATPWLLGDLLINALSLNGGMWRDLVPYTFNYNLAAFETYLRGGNGEVSVVHCLSMLLIYTVGLSLTAVVVFRRRDIAG
jgi:ABC-type transport system involved in multi-copper enzyme maturation permease subunit